MDWNEELEERLTALRLKEISGTITLAEEQELVQLMASLEADEAAVLTVQIDQIKKGTRYIKPAHHSNSE